MSSDEAKLLTMDISAIMLPKVKKDKAQRVYIAEYIRTITPDQPLRSFLIQVASFLIALPPQTDSAALCVRWDQVSTSCLSLLLRD